MKNNDRYTVPVDEGYEPGLNNSVLKNYFGIKSKDIMENLEEHELERTETELLKIYDEQHQFTAQDICNIHELWLGDIYPFAGRYRTVNMEKDGFPFAAAERIQSLMDEFETKYLNTHTPCHYTDVNELAYSLGVVHVEFILIHPFREGNGRTARLLADLMATQAKMPPLNYDFIDQNKNLANFKQYILAIHAGLDGNYEPMKNIFDVLLK